MFLRGGLIEFCGGGFLGGFPGGGGSGCLFVGGVFLVGGYWEGFSGGNISWGSSLWVGGCPWFLGAGFKFGGFGVFFPAEPCDPFPMVPPLVGFAYPFIPVLLFSLSFLSSPFLF